MHERGCAGCGRTQADASHMCRTSVIPLAPPEIPLRGGARGLILASHKSSYDTLT